MLVNRFYFVFGGEVTTSISTLRPLRDSLFDKTLQDIAGTEFRKFGHAVRKHVLDDVGPAYRCGELCDQVGLDRRRIGLGFGIDVLVDGADKAWKGASLIAFSSSTLAGSIRGEWNAPPTGERSARLAPASLSLAQAASTASTRCPKPVGRGSCSSPPRPRRRSRRRLPLLWRRRVPGSPPSYRVRLRRLSAWPSHVWKRAADRLRTKSAGHHQG